MKAVSRARTRRKRGHILLMMVLVAFTLMAFAGLAIDMSRMEFYRRRIQTAADAGAIGGSREMQINGTANLTTAVRDDVATNGYTNGVSGATVTVNLPPTAGSHVGDNRYFEVVVSKPYPTTFFRAIKINTMNLKARAVGGLGPSDYCIIALNPTVSNALRVWGNTDVVTPTCSVMVDSNNSGAMQVGGSGCISAKSIDVVGGESGSCASPTPKTGATFLYDPLAGIPAPTVGACNFTNVNTNGNKTLNPGVYCGGINANGNGTLTFTPGLYIINGGGMKINGGKSLISTGGVTFYNTATAGQTFGDFTFNGNAHFQWTAPTSGTYEGILYFQDRNIAGGGDLINGDNTSVFDGLFYAAKAKITYTGNSSINGYTGIVADTIEFTGSSTFKTNYSTLSHGAPIHNGALME